MLTCSCPEPKNKIDGKGCCACKTCADCGAFLGCENLFYDYWTKNNENVYYRDDTEIGSLTMNSYVATVKEYDIWKVVGHYSGVRYYESEKQFKRYGLPRTKSKIYRNVQAFRFTSSGWKEVDKEGKILHGD